VHLYSASGEDERNVRGCSSHRPFRPFVHSIVRRHVILSESMRNDMFKRGWKGKLLDEREWRDLGVTQSRGWKHYAIHKPEPHILLFRRALGTDPASGEVRLA
jgi:hypothetical protein